ncbi:DJ-1 [Trematosphaeria pertusa]|uniref:D-lactate dehydratase n=1 Tax=Trematosphaeria pertusa TaxID=390896 RepID=A0A6A6J708_9PLEO|nr:DJ-1 [Trematosphaeria pertusa]KAF2257223.1 DJ-1 [Trematosphaeria pertusa]
MAPKALILVADGSEEIEFVTPYDVLTRAGFDVKSAGVQLKNEGYAHLSRNIRLLPDFPTLLSLPHQTAHETHDILILPGGAPGARTFCATPAVLEMIVAFKNAGKHVAAICAGTTALVAAQKKFGGDKGTVTSHPSVRKECEAEGWAYSEERCVVDGRVVTSRGPGTAMLFALTIVELLCGKEKRDEVAGPMIVAETL